MKISYLFRRTFSSGLALCVFVLFCTTASSQTSNTNPNSVEMAKMLPPAINRLVVVRVADILKSPRAVQEGWKQNSEEKFLSGAASIPPWIDTLVMGSLVQPGTKNRSWTAGVFTAPSSVTLRKLARQEQTKVGKIANHSAVRTLRDAYLVHLKTGRFAFLKPAFRQLTARWLYSLEEKTDRSVSRYLQQAAADESHIVIAMDLDEMFDPLSLRPIIATMPEFQNNIVLSRSLADLMGDAVGASFSCSIETETKVTIRIGFSREIKLDQIHLRSLFLEVVNQLGMSLPELSNAVFTIDRKELVISTKFSDSSLRLVMSLIVTPSLSHGMTKLPPPVKPIVNKQGSRKKIEKNNTRNAESTPESIKKTNLRYFQAVNQTIDGLSRMNRKGSTYAKTLRWHEGSARKIADLRTENVVPELVTYGTKINTHFRALAASLRGLAVEVDAQQRSVTWNYNYDPGWASFNIWGGAGWRPATWSVESNLREVRQRQADAVTKGAKQREAIWLLIGNEREEITQAMKKRFGEEFGEKRRRRR